MPDIYENLYNAHVTRDTYRYGLQFPIAGTGNTNKAPVKLEPEDISATRIFIICTLHEIKYCQGDQFTEM
jgi:hypothetical protein